MPLPDALIRYDPLLAAAYIAFYLDSTPAVEFTYLNVTQRVTTPARAFDVVTDQDTHARFVLRAWEWVAGIEARWAPPVLTEVPINWRLRKRQLPTIRWELTGIADVQFDSTTGLIHSLPRPALDLAWGDYRIFIAMHDLFLRCVRDERWTIQEGTP